MELSRREFQRTALGTLLTATFLETFVRHELFAAQPLSGKWLARMNELGREVKAQKLSQTAWQKQMEELMRGIDLDEVLKLVDFDKLTTNLKMVDNGARSVRFKFGESAEGPANDQIVFGKQIFALKKDRSVVPHGHNNMTTAFLILKGQFRGRHYDRLRDEKEHYIIKPTIDRAFGPGEYSTISDEKDNVHWFKAASDTGFIFNIHVLDVRPGSQLPTGRVYLDPDGERLSGGLVRAPRMGYNEAHRKYG